MKKLFSRQSILPDRTNLSSYTTIADSYIVVNKLKTTNCTITLEYPQNSVVDCFLLQVSPQGKNPLPVRIASLWHPYCHKDIEGSLHSRSRNDFLMSVIPLR